MSEITVLKLNTLGQETWRYTGQVLECQPDFVRLEAYFNRDDLPFLEILLKRGDRFLETFYTTCWYNIFEIHDREDDRLKGWYCNIATPAVITADAVSYIDLALDLFVYPDGRQIILDEDEFVELMITDEQRRQAQTALSELQELFRQKKR